MLVGLWLLFTSKTLWVGLLGKPFFWHTKVLQIICVHVSP